MAHWCSLYLRSADLSGADFGDTLQNTAAGYIRERLKALGYEAYDPFALMPAMAYPRAVKLFVSPVKGGWIRVIGAGEPETTTALTEIANTSVLSTDPFAACLLMAITDDPANERDIEPRIDVYIHSQKVNPADGLQAFSREGVAPDALQRVLVDSIDQVLPVDKSGKNESAASPQVMVVTPDMLPDDIRGMAGSISTNQASALASRLGANLLGKAGGSNAGDAARGLLQGQAGIDWSTNAAARRIRAVAGVIDFPDDWRMPDYTPLRDSYQLHARKRRNPAMSLLPGDAEAMSAVPDALIYMPIFAGKR